MHDDFPQVLIIPSRPRLLLPITPVVRREQEEARPPRPERRPHRRLGRIGQPKMLCPVAYAGHDVVVGPPPPSPPYRVMQAASPIQCALQLQGDVTEEVIGRGAGRPSAGLCLGLQDMRLEDVCGGRNQHCVLRGLEMMEERLLDTYISAIVS